MIIIIITIIIIIIIIIIITHLSVCFYHVTYALKVNLHSEVA